MSAESTDAATNQLQDIKEPQPRGSIELKAAPTPFDAERRHIENMILKESWRSPCCGQNASFSKALVQYIVQGIISVALLSFCMYQLAAKSDPDNTAVYFSLLSSMVTLYVPAPYQTHLLGGVEPDGAKV